MRKETKSIAGWGLDLEGIRVVILGSSSLVAWPSAFLPPSVSSNNAYSLIAPGGQAELD